MTLPLEGLLVVSLEQAVAAPMCSCRLADAGARVIKIERPEGDFAREYDHLVHGECSYFVWLNRGKQSLVLDLGKQGDKALLEAMLAKADVFIQNLKPGAVAKRGFSIERLRRDYPRLIVCSDGRVFSDLVEVADEAVSRYGSEIRRIIADHGLTRLDAFDLDAAIDGELLIGGPAREDRLVGSFAELQQAHGTA